MTSPDTSSRTSSPEGKKTRYGCRQKRKTAEVSYICKTTPRGHCFPDSQGLPPPAFLFLITTLSKSRENTARGHILEPPMEANAPAGVNAAVDRCRGLFRHPPRFASRNCCTTMTNLPTKQIFARATVFYLQSHQRQVKHHVRINSIFFILTALAWPVRSKKV